MLAKNENFSKEKKMKIMRKKIPGEVKNEDK